MKRSSLCLIYCSLFCRSVPCSLTESPWVHRWSFCEGGLTFAFLVFSRIHCVSERPTWTTIILLTDRQAGQEGGFHMPVSPALRLRRLGWLQDVRAVQVGGSPGASEAHTHLAMPHAWMLWSCPSLPGQLWEGVSSPLSSLLVSFFLHLDLILMLPIRTWSLSSVGL